MPHRASLHTIVTALWILGSACSTSTSDGGVGSGGTTAKGGSGGNNSGGNNSGGSKGSGGASATGGALTTGGTSASGGSSGSGGQAANCPNGSSCGGDGGDLVGTWNVTSSCLTLSGDWDVSLLVGCKTVPVTGSLHVDGTWTANGNGTYTDNTTTKGSITFPLSDSCLTVSSTPVECSKIASGFTAVGWKTATCSKDASGQCNCSATAEQPGGIGVVSSWASNSGTYTTSGSGLNVDDDVDYSYCVSGSSLTLTPKPTILPVTGTIVLQKSSSGTGGTGGATTGAGGITGTGGTTGSGGATTGAGGKSGTGGTTSTGGTTATGTGPCDIYAAANNTCVAAHSTVRALLGSYNGPLYQVKRASDSKTQDIGLAAGGFADSDAQDTFCKDTTCTITKVYDQSGNGNFVEAETSDSTVGGNKGQSASNAAKDPLTVGGHKVYSLWMNAAQAYWRDGSKSKMPTGNNPQGIYMVTSGTHQGSQCCFDYGNGPLSRTMSGGGTMDALNFSSDTMWGSGAGSGPWVMADLEGGLYAQGSGGKNNNVLSMTYTYVTAIEKNNGASEFALRGADATTGNLSTFYKGSLPSGYTMKKQGAIILGSGGDCCYSNTTMSQGTFYEGAIVAGYPSDATEDSVQSNIISAGYGK